MEAAPYERFARNPLDGSVSMSAPRASWLDGLRHLWPPYTPLPTANSALPVVATHGSRLVLADGRELVDGVASWWAACHGYNHPHIRSRISRQLEVMPHVMLGGLVHEQAVTLCQRLAAKAPEDLDYVFLSESGSVAVEVAMRMAMQYWLNQGLGRRTKFVSFKGGYHGDTLATMSVCDPEKGMHSLFAGTLLPQYVVDLPRDDATRSSFDELIARSADEIAGILVEPLVQGAGGMRFHDAEVLRHIRAAADRHRLLLIFDEIFTGFGRTGSFLACESADVVPDILTLGKGLTGGTLPLAATVANRRVYEAFWSDDPRHALMHGPTYMGNALACAAANAALDLFEREDRLQQVKAIESRLIRELAVCLAFPHVKDVRVRGAIGVVELDEIQNMSALRRAFIDAGVWLRPFRNLVYVTPALKIGPADLDILLERVPAVLERQLT